MNRHPIANPLPSINPQRTASDAWAKTDHGFLADALGDASHLAAQITDVRMRRTDGTEALLPTARPRQVLQLVSSDQPARRTTHSITGATAEPGDPAAEMWHSAHRRSSAEFTSSTAITTAPQAGRKRAEIRLAAQSEHAPESDPIPTWLLGVAALVIVATIAISSLAPWGWALPI